jgi:hypothetical protein
MKGPCWRIYIALFILICLVVIVPYSEGFNSYNKYSAELSSVYNEMDLSYNDSLTVPTNNDIKINDLTNIPLDIAFRKPDVLSEQDNYLFK